MDNKKRINKLWKDNPKIPFMQSKDILTLGYEFGYIDGQDEKSNKENIGFTGTTKELIETTNKLLTKIKNKQNTQSSKVTKEILSKKEKYDLLVKVTADILENFNKTKDFLSVYGYVQDLNKKYQDKLFYIKNDIEFNDQYEI